MTAAHGTTQPIPLTDSAPKVDSNELRWLGEEADGKRQKDYAVIWKEGPKGKRLGLAPLDTVNPNDVVASFVVRTNWQGDGLRGQEPMTIVWRGKPTTIKRVKNGKDEYPDAIFWTQSAFLKFVIPYYARMRSTGNLDDMRRRYFNDKDCIAVLHFEPSEDEKFAPDEDTSFIGLRVKSDESGTEELYIREEESR